VSELLCLRFPKIGLYIRLEFKLADLWVGVFWKGSEYPELFENYWAKCYDVWVCLLPCLPIHISFSRKVVTDYPAGHK
jgi:hypothetical protein